MNFTATLTVLSVVSHRASRLLLTYLVFTPLTEKELIC